MPVVVTGASGRIGRVLLPQLTGRGEVRAIVRDRGVAERLRATGAKVAVADLEDTSTLAIAMEGAHTVIHLAGGIDLRDEQAYQDANLRTTRDAVEVALDAGVARFLFLSSPGAAATSANAYLRAKGMAEDTLRSSGLDHLVLRCTHVVGPGQWWPEIVRAGAARAFAAAVVGDGQQRVAPVHVADVAAALVAADDRAEPVSGTLGLEGPDTMTADDLVDAVARRPRRKLHLRPVSGIRATRALGRSMHDAALELLAADSVADAPDASRELGLERTQVLDELATSLPA